MSSSSFAIFQSEIQKDIELISKKVSQIFSKSYCTTANAKCLRKSIYQCEGTSQKYCLEEHPRIDGCGTAGALMSNRSGILLPNNLHPQNSSNKQKLQICATTELDETFKYVKKKHTDYIQRVYIGLSTGMFRAFPGLQKQKDQKGVCKPYDCTGRPWYIGAVTGSKKVIIAIDTSPRMKNYIKQVTDAANSVISTLGLNDFVGLVRFNSDIQVENSQTLKRATSMVKDDLKGILASMTNQTIADNHNSSNYGKVIQKMMKLFDNVIPDEVYGAPCTSATNIGIFITASPPDQNIQLDPIRQQNNATKMKFYSYGLGDADTEYLKTMSCKLDGASFKINSTYKLSTYIRHYQQFLQGAVSINNAIWSEPYNDANTNKRTFTISTQIHHYINGKAYVVGAAGIDVTLDVIKNNFNISETEAVKKLMKCTPVENVTTNACVLENSRSTGAPAAFTCGVPNCTLENQQYQSCNIVMDPSIKITQKAVISDGSTNTIDCCSIRMVPMIIVITISGLLFLGILIFAIVFIYKKKCKKTQQQQIERQRELTSLMKTSTMRSQVPVTTQHQFGKKDPIFIELEQKATTTMQRKDSASKIREDQEEERKEEQEQEDAHC